MCKVLDKAFKQHLPKAVIVTDLYGQSANYKEITDICNKYRVPIIGGLCREFELSITIENVVLR